MKVNILQMRTAFLLIVLVFPSFGVAGNALKSGASIQAHVVLAHYGKDQQTFNRYLKSIKTMLHDFNVQILDLSNTEIENYLKTNSLIVTLGRRAFVEVASKPLSQKVLATLISHTDYVEVTQFQELDSFRTSAFFADPNPILQLILVKKLFGNQSPYVLVHKDDLEYQTLLKKEAESNNLDLNLVTMESADQLHNVVRELDRASILVVVPDSRIINKRNYKELLLSSYAKNIAIIGFSKGMVKAGATASIFHSENHLTKDIVSHIYKVAMQTSMPPSRFAESFDIIINDQVARSLDLAFVSKEPVENYVDAVASYRLNLIGNTSFSSR